MSTVRSLRTIPRRYSPAEQRVVDHQEQLTAFITDRVDADFHTVEDLVQETWLAVLTSGPIESLSEDGEGLPLVLCRAARKVIHRYFTDSPTWPEPVAAPLAEAPLPTAA